MKKILSLLIFFSILFMSGCQTNKLPKDDIYIYYTSDVHCGVEENLTLASLKAQIEETKAEHEFVTLVDCGDYLQGGILGSLSDGEMVIDIMNEMGYDIATIGNHELDYGMQALSERMAQANFDIVASNVQYTGSKENIFANTPEYIIKDYGGVQVGFIGVLTPESRSSSTPKYFMENDEFVYDFYSGDNGNNLYNHVQEVVNEARRKGADYIVALTHLGSVAENEPYDSISLISHTEGIDVVLDGHSHSTIIGDPYPNKNAEDVILSSVGTKMQAAGLLIIGTDGSLTTMHIDQYDKQDQAIIDKIAEKNAVLEDILNEKICDLDFDLPMVDEEGIRISRSRETTVGNFMADAYRYVLDCDIALSNGGGIRSGIEKGEITFGDLFAVNPFQNNVALIEATGQDILNVLEYGAQATESIHSFDGNAVGEYGGFVVVSGLKYTIDTSIPTPVVVDESGFFKEFSSDQRRVKDVYVLQDGEYVPIDPNQTYRVGGLNYLLINQGDGNTLLKDCNVLIEQGMTDVEALKAYLVHLGGFPDQYKQIEGRITIE